jgi:antitoxin VapB
MSDWWYILSYTMAVAKLFKNGRSQAVRLPKEFRFQGNEVNIRRSGKRVILEPKKRRTWPKGYFQSWKPVPKDFTAPPPLPAGTRRPDIAR